MRTVTAVLRSCALCVFLFVCVWPQPVRLTVMGGSRQASTGEVTREDFFVPHVSTVPANAGQTVGISVRRVTRKDQQATRGPVLFTNTGFTSSLVMFDLDYKSYSIATALAAQGFDVYLMDHTGFGRSPRPTMDDPCNVDPSQQQLLIPNPLSALCGASYPHHLVTIFTEQAEIDSVVDYIRKKTGRDKISLAGWSRSTFRFGLYAAQHPDKIERFALIGPGYRRDAPSEFPSATGAASGASRTSAPPFSFFLRTANDILARVVGTPASLRRYLRSRDLRRARKSGPHLR